MSGLTPTTVHRARTAPGGAQETWSLPDSLEFAPLLADLEKSFAVAREKDLVRVRKWYDTDDWRLFRQGWLLYRERGRWCLMDRGSGEVAATAGGKKSDRYRFARDFPASRIRAMLEPALSIRALLPLFTQESVTICYRVLNRDRKTVALVYCDTHACRESGEEFRTVTLKGVRGYDGSFSEVRDFLTVCGIGHRIGIHEYFARGVESIGRAAGDYSSRFRVRLRPEMPARGAMVKIYRQLLSTMVHNEQGIVDDLDPEFLHDFRVAVRRTRSGLGLVRDVLPPEVTDRARRDFAWLGKMTGPTRDLDVYLLDRDKYMRRLPEKLRPKLEPFFADMAGRREKEWKELASTLRSGEYREVVDRWRRYLEGGEQGAETSCSSRAAGELAREIIFRRYRKVMKRGGAITPASPDEDLHSLRIQCKKLRYILEFFASLFRTGEMKRAVKQLKRLQDNLGSFNDLSVQQQMLRGYLAEVRPGSRKNQDLAAAVGGLLTNLHHEQERVREEFTERFAHFSSEENRQLYTQLFH